MIELEIQTYSGNPTLGLPYWDWTTNFNNWYKPTSGVLTPTDLGTTGLDTDDGCVADGMFTDYVPTWYDCLSRSYNASADDGSSDGYSEAWVLLMAQVNVWADEAVYNSYDEFRGVVEVNNINNTFIHTPLWFIFILSHSLSISSSPYTI
jgi:hypothetical protein